MGPLSFAKKKMPATCYVRVNEFAAYPEFKGPTWKPGTQNEELQSEDGEWSWSPIGDNTMHPFWVVRRLNKTQLANEQKKIKPNKARKVAPRFNCALRAVVMDDITVGLVAGLVMINSSKKITCSVLTNNVDLQAGEELIMEVPEIAAQTKTKRKASLAEQIKGQAKKQNTARV